VAKVLPARKADDDEEDDEPKSIPAWVNPWGAVGFFAATLALLLASLVDVRWPTIGLSVLGGAAVAMGLRATQDHRKTSDRAWLTLSGTLNGFVLFLALVLPGVLNGWWVLDKAVAKKDLDKMVVVARDRPNEEGRPLTEGEWVDATTESIRQGDVAIRVESAKVGPLPGGTGKGSYVLIHIKFANAGNAQTISLEGFSNEQHRPVLTDASGRSFAFLEQRLRKQARGAPAFEDAGGAKVVEVMPARFQDLLLIFASPSSTFEEVRLELPSAAWGQKGACKLRIPASIEFNKPDKKQ
jgi:hypothetical protein